MTTDKFTGKPLDKPSDNLPSVTVELCEVHGCQLIDRCPACGAPVCCPECCKEAWEQYEAEGQKQIDRIWVFKE